MIKEEKPLKVSSIAQDITAIIHTYNEESNISDCIKCVNWCKEVLVIDMYSTDKTVAIASRLGAKVLYHENTGFVEPARAFAVEKVATPWVLIVDADERISLALKNKLLLILEQKSFDVVSIPRLNYFFGKPLLHSGWEPECDHQIRFFDKQWIEFSPQIHTTSRIKPGARVERLENQFHIVHFNYEDWYHFFLKMNQYTTIEAIQINQGKKNKIKTSHIFNEFKARFITHKGYRHGTDGLFLALSMAIYRLLTLMKTKQIDSITKEMVIKEYRERSTELVGEHFLH